MANVQISFYVRDGFVYLPVMAQTDAGFYLDVEPVRVAAVEDTENLEHILRQAIEAGNPTVPTPVREAFPRWVVPKHAGLRSRKAFEQGSVRWSVSQSDGGWTFGSARSAGGGYDAPESGGLVRIGNAVSTTQVIATVVEALQRQDGESGNRYR